MIKDKALHDQCICGGTIDMDVWLDEMTETEKSSQSSLF